MPRSTVPGEPCWVELFTTDVDEAVRFYTGLFGWTHEDAGEEYGGYVTFRREGRRVAGCMRNDGTQHTPDYWGVYLETNDASATVSMAEAHGGQVVVEPIQVGPLGHMALVKDPGGAAVGVWEPAEMAGIEDIGEVGAPGWFEVLTADYDTVVAFYQNVFAWVTDTMSDTAELRYTTLGKDDDARAGIEDASAFIDAQGSAWQFYVTVADTDDVVARAVELGGAVLTAAEDTPYGRLARLADSGGVPFFVMGPVAAA
ncbi:MAG: VOC family protein [Nocardioides sp.]|nr:VOC family protein [Nocardioides sp.]